MTEDRDVGAALRELGDAVARSVTAPPPATVRALAMRWRPVRPATTRTVIALVAAGAVVAVVVGMTAVVRERLSPPPPIGWPSPSGTARPVLPVPTRPSTPVSDPIASVHWAGAGPVSLVVPTHPDPDADCPSGKQDLWSKRPARYPGIVSGSAEGQANPVYGDLTGDGRPEAVLHVSCLLSQEDSGDGRGQLLVVTRDPDGTLRGLGWVGPRGAFYPGFWVADGTVYVDAKPWFTDWGYGMGDVLAYRWDGGRFVTVDSGYRGIQALPDRVQAAARMDLRPVAGLLACPAPAVVGLPARQGRQPDLPNPTGVIVGSYFYDFAPPETADYFQHWVDLAGDGHRFLLVPFSCRGEGLPQYHHILSRGILVLDRAGEDLRAVDFVPVPVPDELDGWAFENGLLTVNGDETWVWNGHYFQH
jgi:hypothetical protein